MIRTLIAALTLPAAAMEQEPQGARVEVNGMQMYYETSGAGDPLIVLHGAYMSIPAMGEIVPKLAETHTRSTRSSCKGTGGRPRLLDGRDRGSAGRHAAPGEG